MLSPEQRDILIKFIQNDKLPEFFRTIEEFGVADNRLAQFKNEFINGSFNHQFHNRLEVFVDSLVEIKPQEKQEEINKEPKQNKKDLAQEYFDKGFNARSLEDKINYYTQVIELDSKYSDAYYNRGLAYDELGQYEEAIEDYTQAIELDSKYSDAYYNRGLAYDELGQYEKALEDYKKAARLGDKDAKEWLKDNDYDW